MKRTHLLYSVTMFFIAIISIGFAKSYPEFSEEEKQERQETSLKAFNTMMQVVTHKRCMNCHPSDNFPRQGEDSHLHLFGIQRGEDGHGTAGLQCKTCHQEANNNYAGVPGAPHWHLAPASMGWQGLKRTQIIQAMTDRAKNGGRSLPEIVKHLTEDPLVLWAFDPGVNHEGIAREKPPVAKEDYIAAVKEWAETGAEIPEGE